MAYIYKITNNVNGKIYIGKTEHFVEKRFKEHCSDAFRDRCEKRPLYSAMNKYGIENFTVETIEETDNPEEREKYWIEYYGSFKTGYNATIGGDGKPYLDYDLVIATYKITQNQQETARRLGISISSVSKILKNYKIKVLNSKEVSINVTGKPINQFDLNGKYIKSFASAKSAAIFLGKITSTSRGASSHITDVCKGKRKSAYGYIWKYSE